VAIAKFLLSLRTQPIRLSWGGHGLFSPPEFQILRIRGLVGCNIIDVYRRDLVSRVASFINKLILEHSKPKCCDQIILEFGKTHADFVLR
jgi:hypothetical protein